MKFQRYESNIYSDIANYLKKYLNEKRCEYANFGDYLADLDKNRELGLLISTLTNRWIQPHQGKTLSYKDLPSEIQKNK